MRLLLALLLILLIPNPALAVDMNVISKINKDGSTHVTIEILKLDQNLTLPIYTEIKNIILPSYCTFRKATHGYIVSCEQRDEINIEYDFLAVSYANGIYTFKQEVLIPTDLENFFMKVILPEGSALAKEDPYVPFDASYATDGRNIFVFWQRGNTKAGSFFTFQLNYEKFTMQNTSLVAMGIASLLLLLFIAIYFFRKRDVKMYLPVLRDDEKIIMQNILEHKNGVHQKIIVRESGYSKAKVSKVLKSLEQRGIIRMQRIGRTNKIYLNPDFKNKG